MNQQEDHIEQLLSLLQAASDSVEAASDDDVRAELAASAPNRPTPAARDIIGARLAQMRVALPIEAGSQVRLKTDPVRGGVVQPGEKVQAGRKMLPVQFLDGSVK